MQSIPVPYQLFNALTKQPLSAITRLQELLRTSPDPLYVKAIGCITASTEVTYMDAWSALCWPAEVLKTYQPHVMVTDLPHGPLLTLLIRGHPLNFGLIIPCELSKSNSDPPQVILYEAGCFDNQCSVPVQILPSPNSRYCYFLCPIVLDSETMKAKHYQVMIHSRPGLRAPQCILYRS